MTYLDDERALIELASPNRRTGQNGGATATSRNSPSVPGCNGVPTLMWPPQLMSRALRDIPDVTALCAAHTFGS